MGYRRTTGGGAGSGASGGSTLTPTATKTAAYTAAAGDLAMMNVAGGATALTLPTAPADKAQVGYRAIGATTAAPLVVTAGGSDTIGTTGAASASVVLADEIVVLQYQASTGRWLAVSNVKTQTSLDGRYVLAAGTVGGTSGAPTATLIRSTQAPDQAAPFQLRADPQTFSGRPTSVWRYAYNPQHAVAGEPSVGMTMFIDAEDTPGNRHVEWQVDFVSPDGTKSFAPFKVVANRTSGGVTDNSGYADTIISHGAASTNQIIFTNSDQSVFYAQAGPAQGGWQFYSAVKVIPNTGNGALTVGATSGQADLSIQASGTNQGSITMYRSGTAIWQWNNVNGEWRFKDIVNNTNPLVLRAGTATTAQIAITGKIGFYGTSPAAQPTSAGTTVGFTAGAGTAVDSAATFTGNSGSTAYTIGDIVKALKTVGLITA